MQDENKFLIEVALKEYDGLRKEIDARTDATRAYGWPVIIVGVGAVAGFRTDAIDERLAVMFVPAAGMTIAALAANANLAIFKARWSLALVEDRIYVLAGKRPPPPLCNESRNVGFWPEVKKFKTLRLLSLLLSVAATALYFGLLSLLGMQLRRGGGINKTRTFVLCGVLAAPAIFLLYNSIKLYWLRGRTLTTDLMDYLRGNVEDAARRPSGQVEN